MRDECIARLREWGKVDDEDVPASQGPVLSCTATFSAAGAPAARRTRGGMIRYDGEDAGRRTLVTVASY